MNFGIMFFSSVGQQPQRSKYRLVLEAAQFADRNDFVCVWTPERHFHEFGGSFPNPSVTSAALAMVTEKIQLRGGSVISPLHHSHRIAEEWSVVDNLSGGRVAIAFGSGWNVDDFIFFPDRYEQRHAVMYQQIEEIRHLWSGGNVRQKNSFGKELELALYPKPVQKHLPVWVTTSGNVETFKSAGAIGANILTHMIGQDLASLSDKIQQYRETRERNDFDPDTGLVTLMLHTFLGSDIETVKNKVRKPFRNYLKSAISLEQMAAHGGGAISGGHKIEPHEISEDVMEDLLDITFERYFETAALMGTVSSCRDFIWKLKSAGVDEIACLIDFLDDHEAIMEGLNPLSELRKSCSEEAIRNASAEYVHQFTEEIETGTE